jgi:hypothetical protein
MGGLRINSMAEGLIASKASTLVSAAMETAGATIQSDMLDWVSGADGQGLAGLLYLLSICSALLVFASGGNYKWGRYLLIGPTLFMFLTTVRSDSDGTQWAFGDTNFDQAALEKAIVGVADQAGGVRVSTFYIFWNAFLAEVNHKLIASIGLENSESQYNFMNKVENYMMTRNVLGRINDPNLRAVVKLTLSNKCREYFDAQRKVSTPGGIEAANLDAQAIVDEYNQKKMFIFQGGAQVAGWPEEVLTYIRDNDLEGQAFTCKELWGKLLEDVKREVKDTLDLHLSRSLQPGESLDKVRETYNLKIAEYVGRYEAKVDTEKKNTGAELYAINWLVAHVMWKEIWEQNSYLAQNAMEGGNPLVMTGSGNIPGSFSENNDDPSAAIQQFNLTESYGQRSEFVTAALSLPHFQGVGLLILSASYPFFAMMTIIPGRALNFLSWMGLWAWLKLWDLGFAVVMIIDNMLYSMFPRGANIENADLTEPGLAFAKMLEVDPMHSEAVYYNLIATCLFAVPAVTAVFVKGGGGELANIITSNWQQYSAKVAGGASSFSRSMQAQTHMKNLQQMAFKSADAAVLKAWEGSEQEVNHIKYLQAAIAATDASISGSFADLKGIPKSDLQAEVDRSVASLINKLDTAGRNAYYETTVGRAGQYAANRAVAVGYYSHDLSGDPVPFKRAYMNKISAEFYNSTGVADAVINAGKSALAK